MPLGSLSLEVFGDHVHAMWRAYTHWMHPDDADLLNPRLPRPWVARIEGHDSRYGYRRTFERGRKDYSNSNSVGSRGIYLHFTLYPGMYEVYERTSWRGCRRYFLLVDSDGQKVELTKAEVDARLAEMPPCLNANSA
jgi:hypothetical protein